MSLKFPANHSREIKLTNIKKDKKKAASVLEKLRWEVYRNNKNEISANTSLSLWSWGEKFNLKFNKNKLLISSKCSLSSQSNDWGKNKMNVDLFIKYFYA